MESTIQERLERLYDKIERAETQYEIEALQKKIQILLDAQS